MKSARYLLLVFAVVIASLCIPSVVAAQTNVGPIRIGGVFSGSLGAGHSAPTVSISGSYRFVDGLAVEGDLSYFSNLTLVEAWGGSPLLSLQARTTSATFNLVYTVPSGVRWLRPYVVGGSGIARVRRSFNNPGLCSCGPRNDVNPVVAAGAGVDFTVWRGMAVGLDFRYQRVLEDDSLFRPNLRNMKRVGTFIGYRF